MYWLTSTLLKTIRNSKAVNMSVFVQKLNPITGVNDWIVQNEDYDYHQEVARSAFADMLHDTERNQLYEKALICAINKMHSRGKKANVLDIGTGTGLLSMMAARNGADSVIACEAFNPMSKCAKEITKLNNFNIKIIPKRSTDLVVGIDLESKCNILVTEVFDTELIGEGAISSFDHAHKHLLEEDCIVVPHSATIYAQIIESSLLQNWNRLKDIFDDDGELLIRVPSEIKACSGSAAVHDVQLSQLPLGSFNALTQAVPVLQFDWSGKTPFSYKRSIENNLKIEKEGQAQAVFMWWDLQMDCEGKVILSCAPYWAHPSKLGKNEIPWRDHWMQAIYYFPKEMYLNRSAEVILVSSHDEYSLWFNLTKNNSADAIDKKPICTCGLHVAFSRTRIGQLNDSKRLKKHLRLFEKYIDGNSVVLILSDGFYTGLAASKLGAQKVFVLESNHISRSVMCSFIEENNLNNVEIVSSFEDLLSKDLTTVSLILSEPYFIDSILPWDSLYLIYALKGLRKFLSEDVQVFPKRVKIKAMAVQFKDLHKIRTPLVECEGFKMKNFDDLINASSSISDDCVEAQPLWEYPCVALSEVQDVAEIDIFNVPDNPLCNTGSFHIERNTFTNGIALWVEWVMDDKIVISTGPTENPELGSLVNWDIHTRQGVYLFPNRNVKCIAYNFSFNFNEGSFSFKCKN